MIAELKKSVVELKRLGYDVYQIAGIINLVHAETPMQVHAPKARVTDGKLLADGHLID